MRPIKRVDIDSVYRILKDEFSSYNVPVVDLIEMQTKDPFKVLVTTILSARTNDRTTLQAAKKLFSKADTPKKMEKLTIKEIEKLIYPVGFYRNKARFLKELPAVLKALFKGRVPSTIEELIKLPGVGRKTANLVVAVAFKKPAICVDVHVHRIMNRLGYVRTGSPFETEMALRKKLKREYWTTINSLLVAFGQNTCRPLSPKCSVCPISKYCNRIGVKNHR